MAHENTSNAPMKPVLKNSLYGFMSIVMFFLWLLFLCVFFGGALWDSSVLFYLLEISPAVGIILAVIGLLADKNKGLSIIGTILIPLAVGLLIFVLYTMNNGNLNFWPF